MDTDRDEYVIELEEVSSEPDTFAGRTGLLGIAAELAASPSGNLAVASCSDGSFLYINDGHGEAWTPSEQGRVREHIYLSAGDPGAFEVDA